MQHLGLTQIGSTVVVSHLGEVDLSENIVNYLVDKYGAKYLSPPIRICAVPNTTVLSLYKDKKLQELSAEPWEPAFRWYDPTAMLKRQRANKDKEESSDEDVFVKLPATRAAPKKQSSSSESSSEESSEESSETSSETSEEIVVPPPKKSAPPKKTVSAPPKKSVLPTKKLSAPNQSIFELPLTTKQLATLKKELKKTKENTKTYYKNLVDDYKVGDRVIYDNMNYAVVETDGSKSIELSKVNMLGEPLGTGDTIKVVLANNGMNGKWKKWFWVNEDYNPSTNSIPYSTAERGILLFDNGPRIDSTDSIYLKYKTLPPTMQARADPEVDMMVSVFGTTGDYTYHAYSYTITDVIDNDTIKLKYVPNENTNSMQTQPPSTIKAQRIKDNNWKATGLGRVVLSLGSWTNEFRVPR
jgi:hypothetical protein